MLLFTLISTCFKWLSSSSFQVTDMENHLKHATSAGVKWLWRVALLNFYCFMAIWFILEIFHTKYLYICFQLNIHQITNVSLQVLYGTIYDDVYS